MDTPLEELESSIAYEEEYFLTEPIRKGWTKEYTQGYIDGLKQAKAILTIDDIVAR